MGTTTWRWVALAGAFAVLWTASVALAVALVGRDDPGAFRGADQGDFDVQPTSCTEPDGGNDSDRQVTASRVAEGLLTNTTEDTRDFVVDVQFLTDDGVRVDRASTDVTALAPGQTARFEVASYLERARGAADCGIGGVRYPNAGGGQVAGSTGVPHRMPVPPVVYSTTGNTDDGTDGDVGDIDAVTYVCYVVDPRVPVTCGTVSN